ncbi:MAG TPA: hypothetical protein VGO67_01705 [Verrucomicrobiae bacterium]|jgi:hypothetical protein
MKQKMSVVLGGMVGSLLIIYGTIAHSSVGLFGLFLAAVAIIAAGCIRSAPHSDQDQKGTKAAVIASVLGQH